MFSVSSNRNVKQWFLRAQGTATVYLERTVLAGNLDIRREYIWCT